MKLSVNVTKSDYQEYLNYTFKRVLGDNKSNKKEMIKNIIIWFIIALIFISVFSNPSENLKSFHLPTALFTATPLLIYIGAMMFYSKHTQNLSMPKDDGLLLGSKEIEINEKGITETNNFGTAYYKWTSVESIEEVNGNVYVYFDTILGYIFPRTCFKDAKVRNELIETITQKIT